MSRWFTLNLLFLRAIEIYTTRQLGNEAPSILGSISSHLSRPGGGGNRWPPAIVPDTRYVGRCALCTFGRVFASSFDLRGWRSTVAGRERVFRRKWPGKRRKSNRRGKGDGGWRSKVGRAEHGKDMVERIQVVRWRNRERGRSKERMGRVATSMLEKHREALRAKYHSSRAGSFFGRREHGIAGARKKSSKRSSFPSPASNIKREIYARTSAELRKTLFSTGRKSFEIRPRSPTRSRRLGTRNFHVDKSAINGIRRETVGATRRVIRSAC